jgi:hypothetical protein
LSGEEYFPVQQVFSRILTLRLEVFLLGDAGNSAYVIVTAYKNILEDREEFNVLQTSLNWPHFLIDKTSNSSISVADSVEIPVSS